MKNKTLIRFKKRWKGFAAAVGIVFFLGVFVIPPAILLELLLQPVEYQGEASRDHLQEIHTAEMYGLEEAVHTLETEDGEKLWCAEVFCKQPRGVILYLTGITKPSVTQFYGHSAWLKEHGFASFLLEVRAHGNSSGRQIGLGYTEVADAQSAVEYIKSQPEYEGVPLVIWGVSMGGVIALNSFGQMQEIDACIAMSPYASFETEIDLLMRQYWVPKPLRSIENRLLEWMLDDLYGSETVDTLSPDMQIQNIGDRPLFLVACTGDRTVPVENMYILREKAPEAEFWLRDSKDHFVVKENDFSAVRKDTEYCEKMLNWLNGVVLSS